jgi:hypothetical protein
LRDVAARITYWCTAERTIVLLTVFQKTRQHDEKQIDRAVRAQKLCERDHRGPQLEPTKGTDEIECIEEGGTEPTIALLRRLAAPWTPTYA